jgi:hypothetical protein
LIFQISYYKIILSVKSPTPEGRSLWISKSLVRPL